MGRNPHQKSTKTTYPTSWGVEKLPGYEPATAISEKQFDSKTAIDDGANI